MMLRMEPLGYKFQDLTRDDLLAVAQMDRRTDVTDQGTVKLCKAVLG